MRLIPRSLVQARWLEAIRRIDCGTLTFVEPNGEMHVVEGTKPGPSARFAIKDWDVVDRLVARGDIGLGEDFIAGAWETDDIEALISLFLLNLDRLDGFAHGSLWNRLGFVLLNTVVRRNSETGSRRNIEAHYDVGNDFYKLWLDETMTYSSALFKEPAALLAAAQRAKYERILSKLPERARVLEIGCGWGGFAIEAAKKTGCRVTAITISEEQFRFAKERVAAEQLEGLVDIVLSDYREMQGAFDRIVCVEMLEAVGHAYYGTFFAACDRLLKPGGRVVLQVICIPDQRYDAYRRNPDWIQRHIFPGGMLPSLTELCKAMTKHSRFTVEHLDNIGIHYAETLRRWRQAFEKSRAQLVKIGFDGFFQRKWIYYLCYCEAGFQTHFTNDLHLVLARPAEEIA